MFKHSQINPKQEVTSLFHVNDKLKDFYEVKITSPNNRKEQEQLNKNNQLDNLDNNNIANDEIINSLRNKEKPDSTYNFKKDFLVLSFDQTEDQNSLNYKRKVLSKKLMTDITFSLNKAFEFSFQDKIKNNIILTLSNNKKDFYSIDDCGKKELEDLSNIDNNFILNLCSNNIDIKDIFGEPPKMSNRSIKQETFLGLQQINEKNKNLLLEEEILKAKKNYSPEHTVHLVFNYEEDEEFDIECYEFFINFIKKYEDKPLASKVKLVLSYIQEKNPETGKDIYNNKAKNQILHYCKNEYDKATKMYQEQIEVELLKKKKSESKNKKTKKIKSPYVKKITKINGFDSINSVRKKNLSNLNNNNNNMMSNLKNMNNDINISSFSSEKKNSKKKIIKSKK
jgi:hypothetical protein